MPGRKNFNARLKIAIAAIASSILILGLGLSPASAATVNVTVASVSDGANTFIKFVNLTGTSVGTLRSVKFEVLAKPGATAKAITGTYSSSYLKSRSYLNVLANTATIPVYGLYQNYSNTVKLTIQAKSSSKTISQTISTGYWNNGCNENLTNKTVVSARNPKVKLDYSYFMLKTWACDAHPVVMDVDGEVRWAGTAGNGEQGSSFLGNSFYLGWQHLLYKIETDGTYAQVGDYSEAGYSGFHHNIDFGKDGLLLDLHHFPDVESNIIEVNAAGRMLRNWDMGAIFDEAIGAPSEFVRHIWDFGYGDWFHNNAATYWKQRNELVVSSRENFVVGIGYDDKKIHWILGDHDKSWYVNYPALQKFALHLPNGTHPPIGQHAVSITSNGNLMLFDNGYQSFHQDPAGSSRSYSAPRQYQLTIKRGKFEAKEVWSFEHGQELSSQICSSIYQFGKSYLVDYASDMTDGYWSGIRLIGLDANSNIAFEWKFYGTDYYWGWNALPIGFENLSY